MTSVTALRPVSWQYVFLGARENGIHDRNGERLNLLFLVSNYDVFEVPPKSNYRLRRVRLAAGRSSGSAKLRSQAKSSE
jgi:hypothetical protein